MEKPLKAALIGLGVALAACLALLWYTHELRQELAQTKISLSQTEESLRLSRVENQAAQAALTERFRTSKEATNVARQKQELLQSVPSLWGDMQLPDTVIGLFEGTDADSLPAAP